MNPQIDLSTATLQQLGELAEPFVDRTPEDVIVKLIQRYKGEHPSAAPEVIGAKDFGAGAPNLGHTKLLSASLNGALIPNVNWNRLLDQVIIEAAAKIKNVKALRELIVVNCVEGPKEENGYRFLPEAGVSVQGQDSNGAWKGIAHICKSLKFPVEVLFTWYDNPKAANPGQSGKLSIN